MPTSVTSFFILAAALMPSASIALDPFDFWSAAKDATQCRVSQFSLFLPPILDFHIN
jgi:hypothetical protein